MKSLRIAVAVLAVAALGGPAAARDLVPFHGAFAGSYTVEPIPNTPIGKLLVSAGGVANHLGLFELKIPHVVNFAQMSATGTYHFTAANGDEVNGTFTGNSTPVGNDGRFVLVVEDVTITGGTGRFTGASGSFTTVRLVDRVNLETAGYFEGSISRPRRR